jgi:heptosyltransferase I
MKILVVRLSSMGDMIHSLPAITDAWKAFPSAQIDWAIDDAYAQIPAWHPGIRRIIQSAHRSWGRSFWHSWRSGTFRNYLNELRSVHYDFAIDIQGEIKSAAITRAAKAEMRCGFDRASIHEWGAQFAYRRKSFVAKKMHSIQRMRQLMASSLGYSLPATDPDFAIDRSRLPELTLNIPRPFIVFIHSTSWASKVWPESYWQQLRSMTTKQGFTVVFPWGDEPERIRSQKIAGDDARAIVLPDLSIAEKASVIAHAHATVGLDTGLSHIAAALDIPSITLYGATEPIFIGATGRNQVHMASEFECIGCHAAQCTYPKGNGLRPSCFVDMTPDKVWNEFSTLLNAHQ